MTTNDQPAELDYHLDRDALREHVRAAGPDGVTVDQAVEWARSTNPGHPEGNWPYSLRARVEKLLSDAAQTGVGAGDDHWYVQYDAGCPLPVTELTPTVEIVEPEPAPILHWSDRQQVTFIAVEHARPSKAEVLYLLRESGTAGQRPEDVEEYLGNRYLAEHIPAGQPGWWLGELTAEELVVPTVRGKWTYFVHKLHAEPAPQEVARLRLPADVHRYASWLHTGSAAAERLRPEEKCLDVTTDYVRHEKIGDAMFAVFYDRPIQ